MSREATTPGFGSSLVDASALADEEKVAATRAVAEEAHAAGVLVEAELGELGGKDGVHVQGVRTDPDAAAPFVEATRVDAIPIAVGASHAMTDARRSTGRTLGRQCPHRNRSRRA